MPGLGYRREMADWDMSAVEADSFEVVPENWIRRDRAPLKALIAGELDSYEGSPASALIAGSTGADVKILGCTWPKLTYSLFAHDGIATIADLKGKKIGVEVGFVEAETFERSREGMKGGWGGTFDQLGAYLPSQS